MSNVEKFIRPEIISLGGYAAHTSPDTLKGKTEVPVENIIKLDANENPYGCSPEVYRALGAYRRYHIYPDAGQTNLRRQLAEYAGVDAGQIVAADGSGELLDDILCLLLKPGDEVINCPPTFDMYRTRTLINHGKLMNVPRDRDFAIDVNAVKKAVTPATKLIVLANPNNPTGNLTPEKDIMALVNTGLPVLVDEAYYEFCGGSVAPLVSRYPNLMVLRTSSKWAALAGLRLGYGIFAPEIAGYLMKIKLPYNVNVAALVALTATLKDIGYLKSSINAIVAERERLFGELSRLKLLRPLPSQANFIFCHVQKGQAGDLCQKLQSKGILVRYFDQPQLQNSFRISVGKPEHTDALMKVLRELEAEIDG